MNKGSTLFKLNAFKKSLKCFPLTTSLAIITQSSSLILAGNLNFDNNDRHKQHKSILCSSQGVSNKKIPCIAARLHLTRVLPRDSHHNSATHKPGVTCQESRSSFHVKVTKIVTVPWNRNCCITEHHVGVQSQV